MPPPITHHCGCSIAPLSQMCVHSRTMETPLTTCLQSCAPRIATERTSRESRGHEVAKIAEMMGTPLMPWQRQVVDVALEVDDAGELVYREVVLTVPRQSGKSTLLVALMLWRCLAWGNRQRVAYTAQTGSDARKKVIDDFAPMLMDSPLAAMVQKVYRLNGDPSINFVNGSRIQALPTTITAGHGMTLTGGGFIDEAFADVDDRREQALLPAMATCPDAQLWVVSTAGTDESAYLNRKVLTGRECAVTGSGRIAYFEWSAPDGCDADDPQVWAECMPALGHTISTAAVEHARATMPDGEFRRAYLNIWTRNDERVIPGSLWDRVQSDVAPDGRLVFAVDVTLDRSMASIVAADETGCVEVVDNRQGVDWLPDRIAELTERHRAPVALDAYGPAGVLADVLEERKITPIRYTTRDACFAANLFYDEIVNGTARVRPHDALTLAVAAAEKKPLGSSWLWARMNPRADLSPLHAATIAYHAARHRNTPTPRPVIF